MCRGEAGRGAAISVDALVQRTRTIHHLAPGAAADVYNSRKGR